jgi:hypothetical protein
MFDELAAPPVVPKYEPGEHGLWCSGEVNCDCQKCWVKHCKWQEEGAAAAVGVVVDPMVLLGWGTPATPNNGSVVRPNHEAEQRTEALAKERERRAAAAATSALKCAYDAQHNAMQAQTVQHLYTAQEATRKKELAEKELAAFKATARASAAGIANFNIRTVNNTTAGVAESESAQTAVPAVHYIGFPVGGQAAAAAETQLREAQTAMAAMAAELAALKTAHVSTEVQGTAAPRPTGGEDDEVRLTREAKERAAAAADVMQASSKSKMQTEADRERIRAEQAAGKQQQFGRPSVPTASSVPIHAMSETDDVAARAGVEALTAMATMAAELAALKEQQALALVAAAQEARREAETAFRAEAQAKEVTPLTDLACAGRTY